jgi:hypothetical protein
MGTEDEERKNLEQSRADRQSRAPHAWGWAQRAGMGAAVVSAAAEQGEEPPTADGRGWARTTKTGVAVEDLVCGSRCGASDGRGRAMSRRRR